MCCRDEPQPQPAEPTVLAGLDYLVDMYASVHTGDRCNTEAGHWINEAFVVRLWAVMEAYHVVGPGKVIDPVLDSTGRVDLCRRLRNKIAHATARVGSSDSRKLDREIRKNFGLGDQESIFAGCFILSKDRVLGPMYTACHKYCEAFLRQAASTRHAQPAGG